VARHRVGTADIGVAVRRWRPRRRGPAAGIPGDLAPDQPVDGGQEPVHCPPASSTVYVPPAENVRNCHSATILLGMPIPPPRRAESFRATPEGAQVRATTMVDRTGIEPPLELTGLEPADGLTAQQAATMRVGKDRSTH
jgi:hypothetical protein